MLRKFIFAFIALILPQTIFASTIIERSIPDHALKNLVEITGLNPQGDLLAQTQKNWLRSASKERWEINENSELRAEVIQWGIENNVYNDWNPSKTYYDKALILGATYHSMKARLDYLSKLWDQGVRFHEVIWLVGERPLSPAIDEMIQGCETETDLAKYLWEHSDLKKGIKALPVTFVNAPMKTIQGKTLRPNTQDTIIKWLESNPSSINALFVSSQPYCHYQFEIIKASLRNAPQVSFEVVGPHCDAESNERIAAITLDSMARCIYASSQQ